MSKLDAKSWIPYWEKLQVTTFNDIFKDNYDDSILDFWQEQLQGNFQHIVDLACGNGALSWICNDLLNINGENVQITGVDFSDINPFKFLGKDKKDFPSISFVGNTGIEKLPFDDASIDLAISQYGLEYSDLDKTIPELGRVLKANAKMAFILHDVRSSIIKGTASILDDIKYVANELRLHDLFFELDELYQTDKNIRHLQATDNYKQVMTRLNQKLVKTQSIMRRQENSSLLSEYSMSLIKAFELTPKNVKKLKSNRKNIIEKARDQLFDHIARLEGLHSIALCEEQRDQLVGLIEKEGFNIVERRVLPYKTEENFGTVIVASR